MTEVRTKQTWATWLHIAGVAYAVTLLLFIAAFTLLSVELSYVALAALTVATVAFVGGWGRYMGTKK